MDLGGLVAANPVWVGSSELTMTLDGIVACVDAGAGAVVAKSVNESAAPRRQLDIADYAFVSGDRQVRPPGQAYLGDSLLNRSGLAQVTASPGSRDDFIGSAVAATREYAEVPPLPAPAWLPYTARWTSSGR